MRLVDQFSAWCDLFGEALQTTLRAPVRSGLCVLGIAVGIASALITMGIGQGAQRKIVDDLMDRARLVQLHVLADNMTEATLGQSISLEAQEIQRLMGSGYLKRWSPKISINAQLLHHHLHVPVQVTGVSSDFFKMRPWQWRVGGQWAVEAETDQWPVAVINQSLALKLSDDLAQVIGEEVLVNEIPVRIIGVADDVDGQGQWLNVWMPFSTMNARLVDQLRFTSLALEIKPNLPVLQTIAALEKWLLNQSGRTNLRLAHDGEYIRTIQKTNQTIALSLTAIAIISLFVGGGGVMNVVYMAVAERRQEIGIRLAVGASREDVLHQFLAESIVICLAGCLLGIVVTYVAKLVLWYANFDWQLLISGYNILMAVLVSILVGLTFGYMPARVASRSNIVEILARE